MLEDFRHMMFIDACFLVQYMAWSADPSDEETDPSLRDFFYSHHIGIHHDVWQLENQLPWSVVEAVMMGFQKDRKRQDKLLEKFVASWRYKLQDRKPLKDEPFFLYHSETHYDPPHLLGLLWYYTIGRGRKDQPDGDELESLSFSNSAVDLAQIGISITANKTGELVDMGLTLKDIRFAAEISLAPLSLDHAEDSAVCSYLVLLSMLVHREEDVHELRRQDVLQGGGGLTNKQALDFFSRFQSLPKGIGFIYTMMEIEGYKRDRKMQTKVRSFLYHGKHKTVCMLISKIGAVATVVGTLIGIYKSLQHAS
ncbi:hypothetical protein U9M48_004913 [Paspalum notatum var. saurae]|uniref:Uncharacterized protein n=1 Tax=Paspalum notatum var. saurae TaxID=547442 RepID=A0AAQ3SJF7_PASNO